MAEHGRLIVVEGTDGAGKRTQCAALKEWLETARGLRVEMLDFPQYDTFYGQMIGRYMRGDFGSPAASVDPYLVSLMYAADRHAVRDTMAATLAAGTTIIANRYVGSNLAFQVAKLPDADARGHLRDWIIRMEYAVNRLPRPDCTLLLYMPLNVAQKLIAARPQREHLQKKADIHETDLPFLQRVEDEYLYLAAHEPDWHIIPSANGDQPRPLDQITADMTRIVAGLYR